MTKEREENRGSVQPRRSLSYRIVRLGRRWTMLIGLTTLIAQGFALGCGGDSPAPTPPPLNTGRAPAPPPPAQTESSNEAEESSEEELTGIVLPPPEETFAGTLGTTATVPFGGSGFCKYDITLRDVAIEVAFAANGEVAGATVRDLAVEKALDGCPYGAMAPSIQDFTLKSQAVTTTGSRVELAGAKTNRPETALVIDLVPSASGGYDATATWKRTDQKAPLAWSVTAKVKLAKK